MGLTFSIPEKFNFEEVLVHFASATEITIVTYGIDKGTSEGRSLIEKIKNLPEATRLRVITNIPGRFTHYYHNETKGKARDKITKLLELYKPENFPCPTEVRFCFENHSKIILCDDRIAYVGSANFTSESSKNYECGYTTTKHAEIRLVQSFIETLVDNSVPYYNIDQSKNTKDLCVFAISIPELIHEFESANFEWHTGYSGEDVSRFNPDNFCMPRPVEIAVLEAFDAASAISAVDTENQPPEVSSIIHSDVIVDLESLHSLMIKIRDNEVLKRERDSSDILSDFIERSPEEPETIQQSEAFQNAVDAEERKSVKQMERQANDFISKLRSIRCTIFSALTPNPKIDNTRT